MRLTRSPRALNRRRGVRRAASGLVAAAAAAAMLAAFTPVRASNDRPVVLAQSIAPQPLADAITALMLQTGLNIGYLPDMVEGRTTHGAPAHVAPLVALAALLDGTGVDFETVDGKTLTLVLKHETPPPPASRGATDVPASPPDAGPVPLEYIVVTGMRHARKPDVPSAQERRLLEYVGRELELRIERSERLYGHMALDQYLQGIVDDLLASEPQQPPGSVRVKVIKDAQPSAFALPNGAVYVSTELLYRLGSEAEIAAVLSHEISHFTNAHAVTAMHDQERAKTLWRAAGIVLAILEAAAAAHVGVAPTQALGQVGQGFTIPAKALDMWMFASLNGYSRDLERDADYWGMRRLVAAGYDAGAAVAAFERLAAADVDRPTAQAGYFASRPNVAARAASYRALVAGEFRDATGPERFAGRDEYRAQIAGLGLDQAEVLVESGALQRAQRVVDMEIARGDSARAAYLEGEIARRIAPQTPESERRAIAAYARAITYPEAPAAAYRQQGILYRRSGDSAAATVAFQSYLDRAPQAPDVPLVKLYLNDLKAPATMAPRTTEP